MKSKQEMKEAKKECVKRERRSKQAKKLHEMQKAEMMEEKLGGR